MPAVTSPDVQVGNQVIPSARQRFEQAKRLGYVKSDFPLGRLTESWRDCCEEQQIPFIVLATRGRSWEITYAVPADDPFVLRTESLEELHRRIDAASLPSARSIVCVTERQGQITGLSSDCAEAVYCYLSEILGDPACLRNGEGES
jgi:hypothetical protein